ncbi:hypothetical protein NPIL_540751 [Nephila pilipes]|uniref:Uncharacterized protein n=1 Tax=Nephila pilipes TaxID=299642 RepID=A0A8X6TU74_NEPPI|nr:hypothetical protein NPIL_540751 [Nephila pilipes]
MSKAALSAFAVAGALWDVDEQRLDFSGEIRLVRNEFSKQSLNQFKVVLQLSSFHFKVSGFHASLNC